MSELGEGDIVFDQTGQQVYTQFNAEAVMVTNHIAEGAGGKRCPRCNAAPMRQTSIAWDENTRRSGQGTMVLNHLALRVAPPRRPRQPHRSFPVKSYLCLVGTAPTLCCCSNFTPLSNSNSGLVVQSMLVVGFIAALGWTVFSYVRHSAAVAADREQVLAHNVQYERNRNLWRHSWFCGACGAIAVERR